MKRIICLIFAILATSVILAQEQQGIVKTNGRPNKPGSPLGNVAVKASGRSVSLSSEDGTFSIAMNDMKGGEAFFLTSVTKIGYELADKNSIGRKYGFSASVPMVLTMVSKSELEAEKQRIRNNAIVTMQKNYEQRVEELEKKLEEQIITADVFGEQLQELQSKMDKYNELVENLADKYARTDYDQIDAVDQEINQAIEEGLFDKADSLIHSKGNIDERHQKAMAWSESSRKQKKALDWQMAQWEISEASRLKELENLAEDYYHSFSIEVSRMHPEEAVKWLEKRLELDPERFEWLIELGRYYRINLAKYDKAIECFDRAYKIAQKTKQASQFILVLNEQGIVHYKLHDLENAEKCFLNVLKYAEKDVDDPQSVSSVYCNMGMLESANGNYDKALSYYEKVLSVVVDSCSEVVITAYGNISNALFHKNLFDLAESYLDTAIRLAARSNNKQLLASCYTNKGAIYFSHSKEKESLEYYEKALAIQKEIYPEKHPVIANTLSNISSSYMALSRMSEALSYKTKALEIYAAVYGEIHPQVAAQYGDIAKILLEAGRYDKALTFANKSWEINKVFYSQSSKEYADHCNTQGRVYKGLRKDSLAVDYYQRALETYESLGMDRTTRYATVCNNLSTLYCDQKEYDKALEYINKHIEIVSSVNGIENRNYIRSLHNRADIYKEMNRDEDALALYKEAETLALKLYGKWHIQIAINYNNVGNIYMKTKEYDKARNYFLKALEICDSIYREPAETPMIILSNIAMSYYRNEEWKETLPWIEKAAAMRSQFINEEGRRHAYHIYIYNCYAELTKGGDLKDLQNFKECQDSIWFKVRIIPDGVAAKNYGLSGEYILLEYGDWHQGGESSAVEAIELLKKVEHKNLVIYRDGEIQEIQFKERDLDVRFFVELLDRAESQKIRISYEAWREENKEQLSNGQE